MRAGGVTVAQVAALSPAEQHVARGNAEADVYAKLGAGPGGLEEPYDQAVKEAAGKVQGALTYFGALAQHALCAHDGQGWPDTVPLPPRA